jgi:hypothetical protein
VAHRWVDALFKEFNSQFALEQAADLPRLDWMSSDAGKEQRRETQVGFIRHVMLPVYQHLSQLIGQDASMPLIDRIQQALDYYQYL